MDSIKQTDFKAFTKFDKHMFTQVALGLFEVCVNAYLKQVQGEALAQGRDVPLLVCNQALPISEDDLDRAMVAAGSAETPVYTSYGSVQMMSSRAVVGEEEGYTLSLYRCENVGYTLIAPIFPGVVMVFILDESEGATSETATVH